MWANVWRCRCDPGFHCKSVPSILAGVAIGGRPGGYIQDHYGASTEPVDFILMDVEMPVMDGIEATRQIRSLQCTQPTIIALTGNTLQETRDACDAAGMDGFISKPLRRDVLNDVLGMC
ncbi:MAG: response regulator [Pseudomonadota bacterium]